MRRRPLLALVPLLGMMGALDIGSRPTPPREPGEEDWPIDKLRARLGFLDESCSGHPAACLCNFCCERWRVVAQLQSKERGGR